jgi:hypothetical protein
MNNLRLSHTHHPEPETTTDGYNNHCAFGVPTVVCKPNHLILWMIRHPISERLARLLQELVELLGGVAWLDDDIVPSKSKPCVTGCYG